MTGRWLSLSFVGALAACGFPELSRLMPPTSDGAIDGAIGDDASVTPQVVELQLLAGDGNGNGNLDGVGAAARFSAPEGMAIDYANVAYLADLGNAVIRKITPEGVVTTFAGTAGARGSDDGTGAAARFLQPTAVAVDTGGNVYVADQLAHTIRKITTAGVVTTLAGSPNSAGAVDGDGAVARFNGPNGIAVDLAKNLYVADEHNHTIRKITPAGVVSTLAGTAGMPGGTDGTGAAASFQSPSSLTIDSAGNLYVVQAGNALRKVTPAGVVTTVVSNKGITFAQGVTTDGADNLYVADRGRHVVLKVTPAEDVTVVAGGDGIAGIADGAGPAARFNGLSGIVIRSDGTIYVSDTQEHTLRAIAPSGTVTTLAGTPSLHGSADGTGADARFFLPGGVAVDRAGTLYVADNVNRTVRKITPAGLVSTLAGTAGIDGSTDGKGPLARFSDPFGTAVDSAGNVWVTDGVNATIRRITAAGVTTTLAGVAGMHSTVDGVGATARLNTPYGIALDAAGNAYVTDIGAHVLRQLAADGTLTTLAGTAGVSGHADGPGLAASFSEPVGVAVGGDGTIYVADFGNHTIRKVTPAGVVTTIAGSAGTPGSADGAGAEARFDNPVGVAVDARNNLYVLDLGNTVVRKITPAGVTTTIAGTPGVRGLTLGGSPQFALPQAIALSGDSLIITDANAVLILRHAAQ